MSASVELAPGLQRWSARHPEWHPADAFGAEVASFAAVAGDDLLLVDPLIPDEDDGDDEGERAGVLALLDDLAGRATTTHVLVTIGYHARSSAALAARFGARIWGPPTVARRLEDRRPFTELAPGAAGPAGVTAHAIGRPRRSERPLHLASHRAIAFGDALVTTPLGELRMWCQDPVDERAATFYRDRFAPTLAPLRALGVQRILPTHGEPILDEGAAALADALDAPPWYHRG